MVTVTLQRDKCIGCNYCVEMAGSHFAISKKDGKSVLFKSRNRNGFHTFREPNDIFSKDLKKAKEACPVNIISVRES